jgi:hypothetical protein
MSIEEMIAARSSNITIFTGIDMIEGRAEIVSRLDISPGLRLLSGA